MKTQVSQSDSLSQDVAFINVGAAADAGAVSSAFAACKSGFSGRYGQGGGPARFYLFVC